MLNGVESAPLLYGLTDAPGSRWSWEEIPTRNIALFASNGVRLFQADLWFEQMIGEDDQLSIALARRQVAGVLAACPDAAVMLRVHVNAPQWWLDRHPGETVGYSGVEPEPEHPWSLQRPLAQDAGRPRRASFCSRPWLDWASAHLRDFCARLAETPEGGAVFGIQVANGVYGEWHQFGFLAHDPDTGEASTEAFRAWLRRRYREEAVLATAWRQHDLTWNDIAVPDTAAREIADAGPLRDPRQGRAVIDYFQFQHEKLAEVVLHLSATVKAAWPRPVITAAFFGYFHNLFGRHAAGGHLSLDRVLASPVLDCLCAPQSYEPAARGMGGTGHSRGLIDPVRRAGKLWLDEMDQPTTVSGCPWDPTFKSDLNADVAVHLRNMLQGITRGAGAWWYDFGPTAGTPEAVRYGPIGWWDHPRLQADVAAIMRLVKARLADTYTRRADVLVVQDPWSFVHTVGKRLLPEGVKLGVVPTTQGDLVTPLGVDGLIAGLNQSGMVHDEALPHELATMDLTPYKLVIYATAAVLDATQRAILRQRVATEGRHVVLTGFAGWGDGEAAGPELAAQLTGLSVTLHEASSAKLALSFDGVAADVDLGGPLAVPAFAADGVEVLGRWADGQPAAVTRTATQAVWGAFAVAPAQPVVLRALGRRAGCHVINDHDETTLAGAGLVIVHTLAGGRRRLVSPDGAVIEAELPPGSTVVFDSRSGDRLIG